MVLDWIGMLNFIRGDVCCAFILSFLAYKAMRNRTRSGQNRYFILLIAWMVPYILLYSLSGTFKYGYIRTTAATYNLVVMGIMISQTMVAFRWFCYSEVRQDAGWLKSVTGRLIAMAPAMLFCLVSVLSIWTEWVFYIDENMTYHRGKLFLLQYVITGIYMVITSAKALVKSRRKENYVQKNELFTLFTFILPPAVTMLLQAIVPMGVFLVGFGFTIAIIMVYLNGTQEQVSQDGLTRLNNRTHMSRFLSSRMFEGNDRLYLLVLDANSFKSINDNYGHIEGDMALLRIAKALIAVAHRYACYVSRYGGDEFIVIQEADSEEQIQALCNAIHEELRALNEKANAPYELSVSIGYSKYSDKVRNIPDFIQAADEQLRLNKAAYHSRDAVPGRADP